MPPARTASTSPRIFLLDGMALAYRAHFAFIRSPLRNTEGVATSAVFGFLAALDRVMDEEQPEEIVVVFDSRKPTFRHEVFPDYKATREKMPDEMVPQLEWIQEAVEGYGLPFLRVEGFEADDVIGTLARREAALGKEVWIVSGDKDMLQLVDDKVKLYNVMKPGQTEPELVGAAETEQKFGVPPEQVIDVLGLMGDSSDNVPGVPGVGPKRATQLVQEHGSVEAVLEAADGLKQKKLRENLLEFADQARLSKKLVTIDCDVPLEITDFTQGEIDVPRLRKLFEALDFRARLERLVDTAAGPAIETSNYHLVDTPQKVEQLARDLSASGGFAFDTETTGLDPMQAELVGISVCWKNGEAWYVPVNLDPPMYGGEVKQVAPEGSLFAEPQASDDVEKVCDALRAPFEDASVPKTGQNMKYDIHVLREHGIQVQGAEFDTMIASFCSDPGRRAHNLDALALERLGIKKIPTSELIGKGRSQITMREVPVDDVCRYACEDADVTWRLRHDIEPELAAREVERVFREAEMPLLDVLVRMEANGIRLDRPLLRKMGKDLDVRITALEKRVYDEAGETFNIRSTATLGRILFDDLQLHKHEKVGRRRPKKTAKGSGYATDEQTMQELAVAHPLPGLVLEYRSLTKLKSTYIDTLPDYVNPKTGRVHTSYSQIGAATGRLASSDPNLQNIPIRTAEGRAIREAFVPDKGYLFVSADYSQVELRLLAHLSGDDGLLEAFHAGEDIHRATAARIFKVKPEDVTPELRGRAKAVNFGIIYGMGPQRLARETNVTMPEARGFIQGYFDSYPKVRAFLDTTIINARKVGYVTTMLGRRRYLPGLQGKDQRVRVQAENVATNTPLQGTAADLIKLAMIRIDQKLRDAGDRTRMLLQIHDELLFEVPEGEVDDLIEMVKHEMSTALPLDVPLVVDVGTGKNWSQAH